MTEPKSLLVEIGMEELPIHAIDTLAHAFAHGVCDGLGKRDIAAEVKNAHAYCAPRRLAVRIPAVAAQQPEQRSERLGPYANIALDVRGQPTKALLGFARKCGVEWTTLDRTRDARGERFVHRRVAPGRATAALVPEIVREAAAALPVPKPMRWGDHDFAFVRPVHWLVMLHGDLVIEGDLFGVRSGRQSRGHRFLHPGPVHLADADSYPSAMQAAKVLADPAERRQRIGDEVARAAHGLGTPRLDDALLEELANLTAWPVAIACAFDPAYLAVPHEALVTTMQTDQKFVPVFGPGDNLSEHFIGVANIESKDPGQIRHGYERVIRPRFADAKFFFDKDLATPLAEHRQALQCMTYQKSLGSLWDKTLRVAKLAERIAQRLFASGVNLDVAEVAHAAELSRCDLATQMVGEFPDLQGVMGRHYARAQGESAAVAAALDSFYAPRQSGDPVAADPIGQVLAIADRLDTLAGGFAAGLKPTGSKDPFALRRTALGLARTLIEGGLDLDLDALLEEALSQIEDALVTTTVTQQSASAAEAEEKGVKVAVVQPTHVDLPGGEVLASLRDFILDRLRGYYAEKGFTPRQFDAVAAVHPASLTDFDQRLAAVAAFTQQPSAAQLAAANKRVANILRKEGIDVATAARRELDASLLREPAGQALAQALDTVHQDDATRIDGNGPDRDYAATLTRLAGLQAPVDKFFDDVMVMVDDPALRANRVTLLARIKARFDAIADIALL